jgi:SAM-dependent methyltransferase
MNAVISRNASRIDHRAALARQQWAYASGDYAAAGNALQCVAAELCESVKLCQDQLVLDVAAGDYSAALAAARRWCDVTATEHGADLVRRSGARQEAASFGVRFVDGHPEGLPFADQSFDAVLSSFGAMFAIDPERAASEMIRVCRRGRRLGLANWTPDGFMGQLFRTVGKHESMESAEFASCGWGTTARLDELFGAYGDIQVTHKQVALRCHTPLEWVDRLRASFPPLRKAAAALDAGARLTLRSALLELVTRFNRASDGTMLVDAGYLEVVITRR